MSSSDPASGQDPAGRLTPDQPSPEQLAAAKRRLARDVAVFSLARLGLVVLIAAVILGVSGLLRAQVPVLVAFLLAVIAALPLSVVLFGGLRTRVNEGIVVVDARRRADKQRLQARLRGEVDETNP